MRILVLSDIHGATEALRSILDREAERADLVLVLGDITDAGLDDYEARANEILDVLEDSGAFVKAIPGNMDDERVLEALVKRRVNLHKTMFALGDIEFIGFGGGTTPFDTPFEPDDAERGEVLETLLQRTDAPMRAIVSHQPPKNTAIDRTADGTQAGSAAVRRLIEEKDVNLVFSGHIHEAAGIDRLGTTVMVNPGPVKDNKYAVVTIDNDIDIELKG